MKWLLLLGVACSSSQRGEPIATNRIIADAAIDAPPIDAAVPRDAFVTTLIPPAPGTTRVIVTESGHPCGNALDHVYFAEGSSEIQPHQQQVADEMATMLACLLKDSGIAKLEVGGHADDQERDPLRVSEDRAVRIANMLTGKGVSAKMLRVVGYGNTQPIDKRKTAAARAKNRRVDFVILERKRD